MCGLTFCSSINCELTFSAAFNSGKQTETTSVTMYRLPLGPVNMSPFPSSLMLSMESGRLSPANAEIPEADPDATPTQRSMDDKTMTTPLFYPTQTMTQYPDPQTPLQPLAALDIPSSQTQADPPASDSSGDDDGEQEEPDEPAAAAASDDDEVFKKPLRPATWGAASRFRRLSDIASQELFPPVPPSSQQPIRPQVDRRRASMFDRVGGVDGLGDWSDSSSSSSSDEDGEGGKSHIPKARRAGVKARMSSII